MCLGIVLKSVAPGHVYTGIRSAHFVKELRIITKDWCFIADRAFIHTVKSEV